MGTPDRAMRACWQWRSDASAWFQRVRAAAEAWVPPRALGLDDASVRGALLHAAEHGERWLVHPVLAGLVDPRFSGRDLDSLRLVAWVAANTRTPLQGSVTVAEPTWVWGHEGTAVLEAGRHELSALPEVAGSPQPLAVPDPWGDSFSHRADLGDLADHAWWNKSDDEVTEGLSADLRAVLAAMHALAETLPAASAWVHSVTQVVVPLASPPSPAFRSGTMAELPGVVLVEVTSQYLLTLEALVHESAHLHFHLEEMAAPFFPSEDSRLYSSPLRVDPRPLRGIFLAYHALAHMVAFYEDWFDATGDQRCLEALPELRAGRDDARHTLEEAAGTGLTDAGRRFLATCLALDTAGASA